MSSAHEQQRDEEQAREEHGGASEDNEQGGASEDKEQSGGSGDKEQGGETEDRYEEGRDEIKALEEADEVPTDPRDWPGGKAKYLTFGGGEDQSDEAFGDGVMAKLGPSDVHHQADGSVIVKGEKVDNPDEYKGEPIPGGPTDPDAPKLQGEPDLSEREAESGKSESE